MTDLNLIVEDGSNVSNANTYYSLASADNYFEKRGETVWIAYDDGDKTYALVKACQYMQTLVWKGIKTNQYQALSWPRIGILDEDSYSIKSNVIPERVKWAQAEIAYRFILDTDVQPDIAAGSGSVIMERVDVIEIRYANSGKSVNKIYQRVNSLLSPFLKYGNSNCVIELVRG